MSARRKAALAALQAELAQLLLKRKQSASVTRLYMRGVLEKRRIYSEFFHLVQELRLGKSCYYHQYMRLQPEQFDELLSLVGERLQHSSTHHIPITPAERLCITLK